MPRRLPSWGKRFLVQAITNRAAATNLSQIRGSERCARGGKAATAPPRSKYKSAARVVLGPHQVDAARSPMYGLNVKSMSAGDCIVFAENPNGRLELLLGNGRSGALLGWSRNSPGPTKLEHRYAMSNQCPGAPVGFWLSCEYRSWWRSQSNIFSFSS